MLCLHGENEPGAVLLHRHTMFPFYATVVNSATSTRAAALMRGNGGCGVHGLLGVRASRVPAPSRLRYCPDCVVADREAAGTAWWRRSHQVPGVFVCVKHGVPLLASARRTTSARERLAFYELDASIRPDDGPCVSPAILRDRERAVIAIAHEAASLLAERREAGLGPDDLWLDRSAALRANGFARGKCQFDACRLRQALFDWFGKPLLEALGCELRTDGGDDWVARMARPPRRSAHPLYHVVVAVLLGRPLLTNLSKSAVQTNADHSPTVVLTASDPTVRIAEGFLQLEFDRRLVQLVNSSGLSLRATARALAVDPLTVQRRAHLLGVWRPEWSMRSCVLPAAVAVTKAAVALDDARRRWVALGSATPGFTRSGMRTKDPAAYALLYRRDRAWLDANSPSALKSFGSRPRVDWCARDAMIAARIVAAGVELRAAGRHLRAIRPATIARAADVLSVVQQHSDRMPQSSCQLARWSENPLVLACERLERAMEQRLGKGLPAPSMSVLAREAGLGGRRTRQLAAQIKRALDRIEATDD